MGFFKNIFRKPSFSKVAKGVVRGAVAYGTFGASEALRFVAPKLSGTVSSAYVSGVGAVAAPYTGGTSLIAAGLINQSNQPSIKQPQGVQPMPLNLGNILGQVGTIFGGSQNPYLSQVGGIANLASTFVPQPVFRPSMSGPVASPVANRSVNLPAVRGAGRAALTQEIFAAGSKLLTAVGIGFPATTNGFSSVLKRALGSLGSLARRTPTGTIVSLLAGIGLTAYESNLLVAWQAQRKRGRRMNVCNAKALRRAGRRIRSFHKLCQHLDIKKAVHHRKS